MIVVGKISAKAILKHKKRPVEKVYLRKKRGDKDAQYILRLAQSRNIPVEWVESEMLETLTGSPSHGGVAVVCDSRSSESLVFKPTMMYMCVEGLSDPYNMGEVLRTIAALGFDGLITPHYDFYEHEAKLIRASAGASESLVWHQTNSLETALNALKEQGTTIVAAHRSDESHSLQSYQFNAKTCICIGGAYRGLSRHVLDVCDTSVRIDYDARVSLSTVGAVSVFAYAAFTQKGV